MSADGRVRPLRPMRLVGVNDLRPVHRSPATCGRTRVRPGCRFRCAAARRAAPAAAPPREDRGSRPLRPSRPMPRRISSTSPRTPPIEIEAPDGRREVGPSRASRRVSQPRNAIASELAWLTALRREGAVLTPLPDRGGGRRAHPARRRRRARPSAPRRPLRLGGRRGARRKRSRTSAAHSRCWARLPPACTSMSGDWRKAGRLRALHLGLRHHPRQPPPLGRRGAAAWG